MMTKLASWQLQFGFQGELSWGVFGPQRPCIDHNLHDAVMRAVDESILQIDVPLYVTPKFPAMILKGPY